MWAACCNWFCLNGQPEDLPHRPQAGTRAYANGGYSSFPSSPTGLEQSCRACRARFHSSSLKVSARGFPSEGKVVAPSPAGPCSSKTPATDPTAKLGQSERVLPYGLFGRKVRGASKNVFVEKRFKKASSADLYILKKEAEIILNGARQRVCENLTAFGWIEEKAGPLSSDLFWVPALSGGLVWMASEAPFSNSIIPPCSSSGLPRKGAACWEVPPQACMRLSDWPWPGCVRLKLLGGFQLSFMFTSRDLRGTRGSLEQGESSIGRDECSH